MGKAISLYQSKEAIGGICHHYAMNELPLLRLMYTLIHGTIKLSLYTLGFLGWQAGQLC